MYIKIASLGSSANFMLNKSKSYTTGDMRSFTCRIRTGPAIGMMRQSPDMSRSQRLSTNGAYMSSDSQFYNNNLDGKQQKTGIFNELKLRN